MPPTISPKRKDPTARSSMMIAVVMHTIAFLIFFIWAAKTGRLDPILKIMNVVQVAKEKPKEKKAEPKEESIKPDELPKIASAPPAAAAAPQANQANAPAAPPAVAPPAAAAPDMIFFDGAKEVVTSTNAPIDHYKSLVEFAIRSNWQRPEGLADEQFVAQAEVAIDPAGKLKTYTLTKRSGNAVWDKTVLQALAATQTLSRPPPKGFPAKIQVRFDVVPDAFAIAP